MTNKLPWMPLDIPAYRNDTSHLTTLQHGGYMLLLMHYWCQGPLPDDDEQLAAIAKMDARTWRANQKVIRQFFTAHNGELHQKRADKELEKAQDISAKRRDAANTRHHTHANADANAPPNGPPRAGANGDAKAGASATHTVQENSTHSDLHTEEKKELINKKPFPSNDVVGSRAREEAPADNLVALFAEAEIEQPKPGNADPELVKAHVRRVAKACEMRVPYGAVRGRADQITAAESPHPPVVEDVGYRWAPAEPARTVEEQLAELERMMRAEAAQSIAAE